MTRIIALTILACAALVPRAYAADAKKVVSTADKRKELLQLFEELASCEGDSDIDAEAEALGLHVQSAVLSKQLGLSKLAVIHKQKADRLVEQKPVLVGAWPAMHDSERKLLESIKTKKAPAPSFKVLQKAITERDWQAVRNILRKDPAKAFGKDAQGRTVLHHAALAGMQDVLKIATAKMEDSEIPDLQGRLPLHYAAMSDDVKVVELLLKKESDVVLSDNSGNTPLHLAKNREIASYLLLKGADPMARDKKGNTPLHSASSLGAKEVAELLLWKKADIEAKNADGETPLQCAVVIPSGKIVETLLKHGAKINTKDNDGQTPLHKAVLLQDKKTIKLLIENGADVNAKDKMGLTPEACAKQLRQMGLIEILRGGKDDE